MSGQSAGASPQVVDLSERSEVTGEFAAVEFVGTADRPVRIDGAVFDGPVTFSEVSLRAPLEVIDSEFGDDVRLVGVEVDPADGDGRGLTVRGSTVAGDLSFEEVVCHGSVTVERCSFGAALDLGGTRITGPTLFRALSVQGPASLSGGTYRNRHGQSFAPAVRIEEATFASDLDLQEATVGGDGAQAPTGGLECRDLSVEGELDCWRCTFGEGPHGVAARFDADLGAADFEEATFRSDVDCTFVEFGDRVRFDRVECAGEADFTGASFRRATFVGARFRTAHFVETVFDGPAQFANDLLAATFGGRLSFRGARFNDAVRLEGVDVRDTAVFRDATFDGAATFDRCTFAREAGRTSGPGPGEPAAGGEGAGERPGAADGEGRPRGATGDDGAGAEVDFAGVVFAGRPTFAGSRFAHRVDFSETRFESGATFGGDGQAAEFEAPVRFSRCQFGGDADFEAVTFAGRVLFDGGTFEGAATFDDASFEGAPGAAARDRPRIELAGTVFDDATFTAATFRHATFEHRVSFERASAETLVFYRTAVRSSARCRDLTVTDRVRVSNVDPAVRLDFERADLAHLDVTWSVVSPEASGGTEARAMTGDTAQTETEPSALAGDGGCAVDLRGATLSSAQLAVPGGSRCVYDFTAATLGSGVVVRQPPEYVATDSALRYCRFERTRFEGFDFERYDLAAADFEIHGSVDAAPDTFDPAVSARNEATYRLAKNAAKDTGYNDAAGQFFQREMRYRGRKHVGQFLTGPDRARAGVRAVLNLTMRTLVGYGERPSYPVGWSVITIVAFGVVYWLGRASIPSTANGQASLADYLVFSTQNFTTLLLPGPGGPVEQYDLWFRVLSSTESLLSAFLVGLFIYALTSSLR